jgi:hypothetical protein
MIEICLGKCGGSSRANVGIVAGNAMLLHQAYLYPHFVRV